MLVQVLPAWVSAGLAALAVFLLTTRPARARLPAVEPASEQARLSSATRRGGPAPVGDGARGPGPGRHDLVRLAASVAVAVTVWAFVPGIGGPAAAAVAGSVTWWRSRTWETAAVRRRRLRVEAELPWLVDLLTAALRSGLGPVEALTRVTEVCHPAVRHELQVPLARLRLGTDPVSVWTELAAHPEIGRLGVALRRATESGAPVVDALVRLAEDLRASRRTAVEVRVRRIEVRAAVPLGVCLLPAFVLLAVVPLVAGSVSQLLGG